MNPGASFSVEFDRALVRARLAGNERLAAHLERIRPTLALDSNDSGEIFANASVVFARDLVAVCRELRADAFDVLLIMAGICAQVIESLHRSSHINRGAATKALAVSLQEVMARLEAKDGG